MAPRWICEYQPRAMNIIFIALGWYSQINLNGKPVLFIFQTIMEAYSVGVIGRYLHMNSLPFPKQPLVLSVCITSLLKTLWKKEKL